MKAAIVLACAATSMASAKFMSSQGSESCVQEDLKHRVQFQNKLAGVCVEMCKEIGAFPKCTCPDFVAPDSNWATGLRDWPALLDHMDKLSEWGHGELKKWTKTAAELQKSAELSVGRFQGQGKETEQACLAEDMKIRAHVQNKLADFCVEMCKEVGAFPKCTCPDFVAPDTNWATGLRDWPALLDHMDKLSEWGHAELKSWTKRASFVEMMKQDPCAGCDTTLAQAYQTCAMKYGNPCAETDAAGLVIKGPGTKKDIGCCMKKEKHDRCLECSTMDCKYKTCNVNKKYYNTYTLAPNDKGWDNKAMEKAGWGKESFKDVKL